MSELTPELLARHDAWLRALIRRLVDDGQTDDVLQEVWGQVLLSPPRDRRALPAWLATVARRVAGRRRRTETRRAAREQVAAGRAPTPTVDPAELVARVEERQHVARAVLALDEPFRTTVLLRYFEGLQPAEIAARLDVPVATVRTRLHRAHDKLRARFERERGSDWRGRLALLCVPLGAPKLASPESAAPSTPTPEFPSVASHSVARLAVVIALPLLLAFGVWSMLDGVSPDVPLQRSDARTGNPPIAAAPVGIGREPAPDTAVVPATDEPASSVGQLRVAGTLLDFAGRPIPRAPLRFEIGMVPDRNSTVVGQSDLRGRFEVWLPTSTGALLAGAGLATLRAWDVDPLNGHGSSDDALVVACPRIRVAGRVVDRTGAPAPGRLVEVSYHDVHGFPEPTAGTSLVHPAQRATTDAEGRFALDAVPAFPLGDLRVDIFRAVAPIPTADTDDFEIVLGSGRPKRSPRPAPPAPPRARQVTIAGRVRDATAAPIAGAVVRAVDVLGAADTGDDGTFSVTASASPDQPIVLAIGAPGFGPQRREVWCDPGADETYVDVVLRAPEHAVTGAVVDTNGRPVPGLVVSLADATPFDFGGAKLRFAEAPDFDEFGAHAETDPDGRFRIDGVLARGYRLRVFDVEVGFAQDFGPFEPDRDLTIRVPARRTRDVLDVHVLDRRGRPVDAAEVEVSVVKLHVELDASFGGSMWSTSFVVDGLDAATDEAGVARFERAPGGAVRVAVTKAGWTPVDVDHAAGVGDRVEIEMVRQVPFRVATSGLDDRWLELKLFDAAGAELDVVRAWRGVRRSNTFQFEIHRGHSAVAAVAETVVRAELRDLFSGELLREMPVVVDPGGVMVLDFPAR